MAARAGKLRQRSQVVVLAALAGCGGGGGHTSNALLSPPGELAAIGAPHLAIAVRTRSGLHRVYLDSGQVQLITSAETAFVLDDTTYVEVAHGRFEIHRGAVRTIVEDVLPGQVRVAPDGSRFAVEQPDEKIAIVRIADGAVSRVALAPRTETSATRDVMLAWSKDGASLLVLDNSDRYRIVVASGERSPIDGLDWKVNEPSGATECPARGLRLETKSNRKEQQIVLVALADPTNPEQLTSMADRVLVRATDHRNAHGGHGSMWSDDPAPGPLTPHAFTPTCEHFVFALEDNVYVGNVATGRHALLARGEPVWIPSQGTTAAAANGQ